LSALDSYAAANPPILDQKLLEQKPPKPEPVQLELKPEFDIVAVYTERLRILRPNIGGEARFRAYDYVVERCCAHYGVDIEVAKSRVRAALPGN
jgi:hypothetical protein